VRVKELANSEGAVSYAEALAELFSLDPQAVEAVTSASAAGGSEPALEHDLDLTGTLADVDGVTDGDTDRAPDQRRAEGEGDA
jgi:hypothetical protein